jgi:hypothetical protein
MRRRIIKKSDSVSWILYDIFFISECVGCTGIQGMAPGTGVILIKGSSELNFTGSVALPVRDLVTLIREQAL